MANTQTPKGPSGNLNAAQAPPIVDEANPMEAFDAGVRAATPTEIYPGVVSIHKDCSIHDITQKRMRELKLQVPGPLNPAGTITVSRPESLIQLWQDHSTEASRIFADADTHRIRLVFDFCTRKTFDPNVSETAQQRPGWCQFTAILPLRESRKLGEWKKLGTEWMGQTDFANFLEDHLEDVRIPLGNDLLSIATDLEANSSGSFKGRVNLQNGSVGLKYQNDIETTVEVPAKLKLGIPLFEHGDLYSLDARLRFNVGAQGLRFRVLLTNLSDALEAEFERIVQELEGRTGRAAIRGNVVTPWEAF